MSPPSRAQELVKAALALAEDKREAFLELACADDEALREEVQTLLRGVELGSTAPFTPSQVPSLKGSGARSKDPPDPLSLVGRVLDERYRIEALVDEGGFGYVYRGHHLRWERPVAIKLFKQLGNPARQQKRREAFIKEGALLAELSRKTTSVVQSYDVGTLEEGGHSLLFTVLEWLEGTPLDKVLARDRVHGGGGWSLERVATVLGPIAEALVVAHQTGIAHRDIKPPNIFLVREEGTASSTPKLLDFGIAKVATGEDQSFAQTDAASATFTVLYAAPEQFAKWVGPSGPWTDVYSLALTAVEMLLGSHPYAEIEGLSGVIAKVTDADERPTPRTYGVTVPDDVEEVFRKALALRPEERYQDAREFWDALTATLEHPPRRRLSLSDAAGTSSRSRSRSDRPLPGSGSAEIAPPGTTGDAAQALATASLAKAEEPPPSRARRALPLLLAAIGLVSLGAAFFVMRFGEEGGSTEASEGSGGGEGTALRPEEPEEPEGPEEPTFSSEIDSSRLDSFAPLPAATRRGETADSEALIGLGRMLFWDPILSRDRDLSCASCHDLRRYGVDGQRSSLGHQGHRGRRNSPTVYNLGGAVAYMWDGVAESLEAQARLPILNPEEMAMDAEEVRARLRSEQRYRAAFEEAFPEDSRPIDLDHAAQAIAAFERQLLSPSRWDRFLQGEAEALTPEERAGFNAFVEVGCPTCHFGPYVGLTMFQKLGLVRAWPNTRDRGRYEITERDEDFMVFRVPSLRNVERTAPYFHDGSVSELPEAVTLMARHQLGRELDEATSQAIATWLRSLTGELPEELSQPFPIPEG